MPNVRNVIVRMLLKTKLRNIRNNLKNHYWNYMKMKMQKFHLRLVLFIYIL